MDEEKSVSETVAAFLNYVRGVEFAYRIAEEILNETSQQTQDILHAVEFRWYDDAATWDLALRLCEVRRQRRKAKEALEVLEPLLQWVQNNQAALNSLERVLGDARKIEQRQLARAYAQRTTIMDGLLVEPERNGGEQND